MDPGKDVRDHMEVVQPKRIDKCSPSWPVGLQRLRDVQQMSYENLDEIYYAPLYP